MDSLLGWTVVDEELSEEAFDDDVKAKGVPEKGVAERVVLRATQNLSRILRIGSRPSEEVDGDQDLPVEELLHLPQSVEDLTEMLKKGVDPNVHNDLGKTPLHSLISRQHKDKNLKADLLYTFLTESVKELDVNLSSTSDGNTALHLAVQAREIELVKILLAFGADINRRNFASKTPLDFCRGKYVFMHQPDSFMEISVQESLNVPSIKSESDELVKLLEDCGAVKSDEAHSYSVERRKRKELFRDFCILREEEYYKDNEERQLKHSRSLEEKAEVRLDWCRSKAKLYYEYWTNMMKYPAPFLSDEREKAADLGLQVKNLRLLQMAGSRILVLDGGGMKGLVEIEILDQIERVTGLKIVDLFDWIVGTSTGAVIALALVYARLPLSEIRKLFFKMKDPVFGTSMGISYNTENLTEALQNVFKDMTMSHKTYPRVIITAVNKKYPENLKLDFFGNHPNIDPDYQNRLVWKVARYSSAAPILFKELDDYVDGGVLANNPSSAALTVIQQMYSDKEMKIPISMMVSLGSGIMPAEELDKEDSKEILLFGHIKKLVDKASDLIALLGNAITESEQVAKDMSSRCQEQGIKYFRCSPHLSHLVGSGETDRDILIEAILDAKRCLKYKKEVDTLALWFSSCWDANRELLKSDLL